MGVIAFDTSNYTTSIAYFDGINGVNCSKLLPVKDGELGLRQSDAVFQHIKSLPELSDRLFSDLGEVDIRAVGVSTRPRAIAGSYMPCFMVGYSHASLLSKSYGVPLYEFSHQQGHVAASLWSSGRLDLLDQPHLAWHLSGGTTELLYVCKRDGELVCEKIGGTTDISAGQLIDRTGQLLGLQFPSGKQIDELSKGAMREDFFRVKCNDSEFSFSGIQNKVQEYHKLHESNEETAGYVLRCIGNCIFKATLNALAHYPHIPVVFSGGVASNAMLRSIVAPINPVFAEPQYSTDNAIGVAVLTSCALEGSYGR